MLADKSALVIPKLSNSNSIGITTGCSKKKTCHLEIFRYKVTRIPVITAATYMLQLALSENVTTLYLNIFTMPAYPNCIPLALALLGYASIVKYF